MFYQNFKVINFCYILLISVFVYVITCFCFLFWQILVYLCTLLAFDFFWHYYPVFVFIFNIFYSPDSLCTITYSYLSFMLDFDKFIILYNNVFYIICDLFSYHKLIQKYMLPMRQLSYDLIIRDGNFKSVVVGSGLDYIQYLVFESLQKGLDLHLQIDTNVQYL